MRWRGVEGRGARGLRVGPGQMQGLADVDGLAGGLVQRPADWGRGGRPAGHWGQPEIWNSNREVIASGDSQKSGTATGKL